MMKFGEFEWDDEKAAANVAKHGVSFEQAITAIDDPSAFVYADDRHDEPRFRLIGLSDVGILVVVFTERHDDITRIISARKATKKEKKTYADNR